MLNCHGSGQQSIAHSYHAFRGHAGRLPTSAIPEGHLDGPKREIGVESEDLRAIDDGRPPRRERQPYEGRVRPHSLSNVLELVPREQLPMRRLSVATPARSGRPTTTRITGERKIVIRRTLLTSIRTSGCTHAFDGGGPERTRRGQSGASVGNHPGAIRKRNPSTTLVAVLSTAGCAAPASSTTRPPAHQRGSTPRISPPTVADRVSPRTP